MDDTIDYLPFGLGTLGFVVTVRLRRSWASKLPRS